MAGRQQRSRTVSGLHRVRRDQTHGAHRGAQLVKALARLRARLGVDDELDVALAIQIHRLAAVAARVLKAQGGEGAGEGLARGLVHTKFDEAEATQRLRTGRRGQVQPLQRAGSGRGAGLARCGLRAGRQAVLAFALQKQQRAHGVQRGAAVGRFAEHVVEDFERQVAGVARQQRLLKKRHHIQLPLAGKVAVVTRPLDHVHGH